MKSHLLLTVVVCFPSTIRRVCVCEYEIFQWNCVTGVKGPKQSIAVGVSRPFPCIFSGHGVLYPMAPTSRSSCFMHIRCCLSFSAVPFENCLTNYKALLSKRALRAVFAIDDMSEQGRWLSKRPSIPRRKLCQKTLGLPGYGFRLTIDITPALASAFNHAL